MEYLAIAGGSGDVLSTFSEDDMVGLPPRLIEYLLGLISVYGGTGRQKPSFQKFGSLVQNVVECIMYNKIREIDPDSSQDAFFQNQVEFSSLNRELSTGRFIFSRQYDIGARKAYTRYNSVLKHEFGFTIEEALRCSQYIRDRNAARWGQLYSRSDVQPQSLVSDSGNMVDRMSDQIDLSGFTRLSQSEKFLRDADYIDRFHEEIKDESDSLWLLEDDLYNHLPKSIDRDVFSSFLERMTLNVGEGGQYRYPFDFNPIHKQPLLKINNKIILPRQRTLMWALIETFYYDLQDMDKGKFGNSFGDYLETWVSDEFSKLFKRENVFLEPRCGYNLNEEAADVIAIYNDTLFIIECKTGKLPLGTREGKYNLIEESMRKKVGEGCSQADTTSDEIQSGVLTEIVSDGKRISVKGYDSYQPLVIVGEPYDIFATSLGYNILETNAITPYITDIYSLQVIIEALDTPELVKKYITERRRMLEEERQFLVPHEIDFLGLFLHYGNRFPEMPDEETITITDMTDTVCDKINYKYGH